MKQKVVIKRIISIKQEKRNFQPANNLQIAQQETGWKILFL